VGLLFIWVTVYNQNMKAKRSISSLVETGQSGLVVDIECQLSNNLPGITIVGYANKAVDEAKERIRSAFDSSDISLPRKRIVINLAPADVPKDSTGFDLAIAAAILVATDKCHKMPENAAIMGELGLDGNVRPIRGIIGKLLVGKRHGIETFLIPVDNVDQARLVPGVRLLPVPSLHHLFQYFNGLAEPIIIDTTDTEIEPETNDDNDRIGLEDVIGQELARHRNQCCRRSQCTARGASWHW